MSEFERGPYYHGLIAQPNCEACPLRDDVKVYPDGPVPARIAIVGEAPGQNEVSTGRGFVGPSGMLLWHLAREAGFTRDDVWVTNASLCLPRRIKLSSGAVLPLLYVQALASMYCRSRLLHELQAVAPKVVIPVGNWALWSLTDIPKAKIYAYRGSRLDVDVAALADLVDQGKARTPLRQIKQG